MRIAVVTGGNKGIGYAISKGLSRQLDDGIVYLTARNEGLGLQAVHTLTKELTDENHCEIRFHRLDVTDSQSIDDFATYLKQKHGGLDILVNNAGIAYKITSATPFGEQAEVTIRTNFFGTLAVSQKFFPLLRPHARVVNLSSQAGNLKNIPNAEIRHQLSSLTLTMDELCAMANRLVAAAKQGTHKEQGFSDSAYGMSKTFVNAMTEIHQRDFNNDNREDLIVNSCSPGYVVTDMTSNRGNFTPDEGADTPIYLAMIPSGAPEPKGKFLYQRKEIDWKADA